MPVPEIAAIVCTYNRAEVLDTCLAALAAQDIAPDRHEIIVIDNNSTDRTAEVAQAHAARCPAIRVVREERQGLAAARNRGMAETGAPLVAFTDDDAEPGPDWLSRLAARFADAGEDVVAVGGEVVPVFPEGGRPAWLTDRLLHPLSAHLGWSREPRPLRPGEWLCEVNSAYRREVVQDFGGFPEDLGRIGTNLLSGENAVNLLMEEAGHRFFFDPGIVVRHHIDAGRLRKEWFRRRMFWQGITGWHVERYLERHRRDAGMRDRLWCANGHAAATGPRPVRVDLPVTAEGWAALFENDHDDGADFEHGIGRFWGLGYLLASQGVIHGR